MTTTQNKQPLTLEALADFGASILARRDARLEKDITNRPKYNTWASGIGECSRQMVYSILNWQDKKLHDARLQARFNEGKKQEDKLKAELREILQELGSDIVEDQAYFPKDMTDRYRVSGKIDGKLLFSGRRLPFEVKSMHPNVFERINTLKKLFNVREGWRPEDDWLPPRLLSEALPTGVAQGVGLTTAELREMIHGYYQAREWDENGFIPENKLKELGLPRS